MTVCPVGVELFHTDGRKYRQNDEANSRFSQFCKDDYKLMNVLKRHHITQKPLAVRVSHLVYPKPQM